MGGCCASPHRFCKRNDSDAEKVFRCYVVYLVLLVLTLVLAVAFAVVIFLSADDFPSLVADNLTQDQVCECVSE